MVEVPGSMSAEPDVYEGHAGARRYFAGFDGLIDEVRAYDRALTAEQIADDRENLITDHVDDPTPVVHLRFDEESGSEAIDSGGEPSGRVTSNTPSSSHRYS